MARDLIAALWPVSFMGFPFYVEKDEEQGGRRLAIHEFYGSDIPFVEDLGAKCRHYEMTAYVASDSYDTDAEALIALLASRGPGMLVMPTKGPVQANLDTYKRSREKDRIGYIAFALHFVDAGASSPIASIANLAQLAFDAVSALSSIVAPVLSGLLTQDQPAWVVAQAAANAQDIVAALDAMQASNTVDATTSASLTAANTALYQSIPGLLAPTAAPSSTLAPQLAAAAVALSDAMVPSDAVSAFGDLFDGVEDVPAADPSRSANIATVAANAQLFANAARLTYLAGYVEALMGATYSSRPEGISARADCVERFDVAFACCSGADQAGLYVALQDLRNAAVAYLSNLIATLAPVVTVQAAASMPSLWWAWRLYQDPARAADLIARNDVKHPSFMPLQFEALVPAASTLLPVAA